jgi:hypothetical protein
MLRGLFRNYPNKDFKHMTSQEAKQIKIAFTQALKASERHEGAFIYRPSNEGAVMCGCDRACSGELVIPETLGGQRVCGIEDAFQDCKSLQSIVIPACVSKVTSEIFGFCLSLEAFIVAQDNPYLCSLDGVLFSKDMTQLFQYPQAKVGAYTVPEGVKSIRALAFAYCHGLTSVKIPDSTMDIGFDAFRMCIRLKDAWLPAGLEKIESGVFQNCSVLSTINIPDCVGSIENGAFHDCKNLTALTLPTHLRRIGLNAFAGCASLGEVTIPKDMADVGPGAFSECISLISIDVDLCNPTFRSVNGVLFDNKQTELVQYPAGRSGAYTIPEGTLSISELAFCGCVHLSDIHFPATVHQIGQQAFAECAGLKSVSLPCSLQTINEGTFAYCKNLREVHVLPNVIAVNHLAFGGCAKLKRIIFEGHAPHVMQHSFAGLKRVTVYHHEGMNGWDDMPEGLKLAIISPTFAPDSHCH